MLWWQIVLIVWAGLSTLAAGFLCRLFYMTKMMERRVMANRVTRIGLEAGLDD